MSIVEHWLRLPREIMEYPVLEILKPNWTLPWATCCSLPCLEQRVGPEVGTHQPQLFCHAVIHHTAEPRGISKAFASCTEEWSPGYNLMFQDLAPHGWDTGRRWIQIQRNHSALFRLIAHGLHVSTSEGCLWSDFILKPTVRFAMEKWQQAGRGGIVRGSVFLWNMPTNQG